MYRDLGVLQFEWCVNLEDLVGHRTLVFVGQSIGIEGSSGSRV